MPTTQSSLETLLGAAVEIGDQSQREDYLQRACAGDSAKLAELQSMVHDYFAAGSLIDRPAVVIATVDSYPRSFINERIGPYKLLEQIGEGGMGTVYMAEQKEPVRRTLALKVIKPGMDTRQVVARFEAERQALAMMNHPNIARVLDAGATDAGRPYFVMELVKGTPLTDFCDQQKLDTRQRLQLFITLCQAVQHAHQKGLIHRDLKPSNVLVEMHDVTPVPKVIDFGVAKAIGQQLTAHTLHTGFTEMIGTPLYMSPEQAGQSSIDVDTRSDIYSLGVLLYELLTGTTPFDKEILTKAGYDELRRIIREDEPPRPSARVSTLQAKALSTVSGRRQVEPRKLSQLFRGELDWIVMKALEKDRTRRYESASALAADVQRYLDDKPVDACPPSVAYRLRKFARRNKTLLMTGCMVALVLIAGTGVSIWQAVEAEHARTVAEGERSRAELNFQKALELIDNMLTRVGYDRYGLENQVSFLAADVKTVSPDWGEQNQDAYGFPRIPNIETSAHAAKPTVRDESSMEKVRSRILDDVLTFYRGFFAFKSEDPKVRHQMARIHSRIGHICWGLGRDKERDEAWLAARQMWEALHSQDPQQAEYAMDLAHLYNVLGLIRSGDVKEAEPYHRKAAALLEPVVARQPDVDDSRGLGVRGHLGLTFSDLGQLLTNHARGQEGETYLRKAITICQDQPDRAQDVLAGAYACLAKHLENSKRLPEALEAQGQGINVRKKVVAAVPESAFFRHELTGDLIEYANLLVKAERPREAEDAYRQALELWKDESLAFRHDDVSRLQVSLLTLLGKSARVEEAKTIIAEFPARTAEDLVARGRAYFTMGDLKNALADYDSAIDLQPDKAACRSALNSGYSLVGERLQEASRLDEAEAVYRKAIAVSTKLTSEFPSEVYYWSQHTHSHFRLAKLLAATGRPKEAEACFAVAMASAKDDNDKYAAYNFRSEFYERSGQPEKAQQDRKQQVALLEQYLKESRAKLGADDTQIILSLYLLSKTYLKNGDLDKALATGEESFRLQKAKLGLGHDHTLACLYTLGEVYRLTGRGDKALQLVQESLKIWETKVGPDDPTILGLYNNLAVLHMEAGRTAEAIPLMEKACDMRVAKLGPNHPETLLSIHNLGMVYAVDGKPERALPLLEAAVRGRREKLGKSDADTLSSVSNLGYCFLELRKFDQAEPLLREVLTEIKAQGGVESPAYANALANLGLTLVKQGKFADAEVTVRECLAIREKTKAEPWRTSNAKAMLGAALLGQKKFSEAEKLLLVGYEGMKSDEAKIPPTGKSNLTDANQRLVELYTQLDKPAEAAKWQALLPTTAADNSAPKPEPVPKKE